MSILVIDDNLELAENIQELLEAEGYESEIAEGGPPGLALLDKRPFELVITDMRMPNMSGLEVVREIKRRWPATPVVLMTAYTRDEILDEAQGEGALGILAKPLDLVALVSFVERIARAETPVLLVEDDTAARTNLTEVLQEIDGVLPHPVSSCAAALELAGRIELAAAVVDVRLPDGDGRELARTLQARAAPRELPVVFITGHGEELRVAMRELLGNPGVHLLEKPFRPEALIDLVRDLCSA